MGPHRQAVRTRLICTFLLALACSAPAAAAGRGMTTLWMVGEPLVPAGERQVSRLDYVFKHRLLPTGLAALSDGSAAASAAGLAPDAQLIEVQTPGAIVFCDPVIRSKKLVGQAQPCFVDGDGDGRFEGSFFTTSVTKGILTIQGKRPGTPKAIAPLAYRRLDPSAFRERMFLGLQYRGNANIVGNHVFDVKYGNEEHSGSLTTRVLHKKRNIPGSTEVLGGRFTILAASENGITVRIDQPLPPEPFGVLQTTTYRVY